MCCIIPNCKKKKLLSNNHIKLTFDDCYKRQAHTNETESNSYNEIVLSWKRIIIIIIIIRLTYSGAIVSHVIVYNIIILSLL